VQGDALLVACGEVLKTTFRESDIIARIGGDEFADAGSGRYKRITRCGALPPAVVGRHHEPLMCSRPYRLSLSVGVARFDP